MKLPVRPPKEQGGENRLHPSTGPPVTCTLGQFQHVPRFKFNPLQPFQTELQPESTRNLTDHVIISKPSNTKLPNNRKLGRTQIHGTHSSALAGRCEHDQNLMSEIRLRSTGFSLPKHCHCGYRLAQYDSKVSFPPVWCKSEMEQSPEDGVIYLEIDRLLEVSSLLHQNDTLYIQNEYNTIILLEPFLKQNPNQDKR